MRYADSFVAIDFGPRRKYGEKNDYAQHCKHKEERERDMQITTIVTSLKESWM
jgi:hypothetical protein